MSISRRQKVSTPSTQLRASSALLVGIVALLLAGTFATLRTEIRGGAKAFIEADNVTADVRHTSPELGSPLPPTGYDGEFVYRLAGGPFSKSHTDDGITLDKPAYRQQRILLPTLAYGLNAASPLSRAQSILAINILAVGLAGLGGALIAVRLGRNRWWGLFLAAQPAVAFGVGLDPLFVAGDWPSGAKT